MNYTVELTEEELAMVIISLELRLMNHTFLSEKHEKEVKILKERLDGLFHQKPEGGKT